MKLIIFICFLICCLNVVESGVGETHSTKAEGTLYCGTNPLPNAVIRLLRADSEKLEDIIGTVKTNNKGVFAILGDTSSLPADSSTIDPYLKIYHKCSTKKNEKKPNKSYRVFRLRYPREYVSVGTFSRRSYNIGSLNMQVKFPNEEETDTIVGWKDS